MTSKIPCSKKGCTKSEDEFHHIVPHFMGGKDIDGRKYLCKEHHDLIHSIIKNKLLKILWNFVGEEKKEECRKTIKSYTEWWLKK